MKTLKFITILVLTNLLTFFFVLLQKGYVAENEPLSLSGAEESNITMGSTYFAAMLTVNPDGSIGDCIGSDEMCQELIENEQKHQIDLEEDYVLKSKLKYIETLREAANVISAYGDNFGLNAQFVQECLDAFNNTQDYRKENKIEN